MEKIKIPNNQTLVAQYCREENGPVTHVCCKQEYSNDNKRWILYEIQDNKLIKLGKSDNPIKLEHYIWGSE